MPKKFWLLAVGLVALGVLGTRAAGCATCSPGGSECAYAEDCETLIWETQSCNEAEGRWKCLFGTCLSICPGECETAEDCATTSWPDGTECLRDEGYWTCEDTFCVPLCPGQCETPADCEGKRWPSYAGCTENVGQWGCEETVCMPQCPPTCETAEDCEAWPWPDDLGCEEADGYWACDEGQCAALCPAECRTPADCEDEVWPSEHACPEDERSWSCRDGLCQSVCNLECEQTRDCTTYDWTLDCVGGFSCRDGACIQACNELACGDGSCNGDDGETADSCPLDCGPTCETLADCLGQDWDAPCEGRWNCETENCVEVCDYDSCGDGSCSAAQGEDEGSCPRDCVEGCRPLVPSDCFTEMWAPEICQGRWSCSLGECIKVCDNDNCGDGVCWGLNGENEDSCFQDCLGGPCASLIDCFAHRWYEDFGGHWQCVPASPPQQGSTGACEAVRDDGGCGDGTCSLLAGETPISCLIDCGDYSCTTTDDCDSLTLPGGCSGWICTSQVCVPQQCE
jgi:hypothetical protein